jgi:hypothetical protein
MSRVANLAAAPSTRVAAFDESTLERLVTALQAIWSALHRAGRWSKLSEEGRYRIHQALGGMHCLWSLMQIAEKRCFKNRGEAIGLLCKMLAQSGARFSFGREMCVLLSHLAGRRQAALELGDRLAFEVLDQAFWQLLRSGAFRVLSNTFRNPQLPQTALERYVAEIRALYTEVEALTQEPGVNGSVRALLSQCLGLGLFEGLREQSRGRLANTAQALQDWHLQPASRRQRGFFADLGCDLHELGMLTAQIEQALTRVRGAKKKAALISGLSVLKDGTTRLVMTGVLNLMS